jgi:hypothetical protein
MATDLNTQLNDPSNVDVSNNTYYINRLLKKTTVKESVIDLSNQLYDFNTTYCYKSDCSGIPHELISDISQNISNIGKLLNKMSKPSDDVIADFSNIQQFYQLTFDCSGGICQ